MDLANPEELADIFRYLNRFRRLRKSVAELNTRSVLSFDPTSGDWRRAARTRLKPVSIWRSPRC